MLTKLIFLFVTALCYATENKPFVQTPLGAITGYLKKSFEGKEFAAFEGIPYAKPPVGNRRFEAPEPIEPWYGTWEAINPTTCPQTSIMQRNVTFGVEDCLHINVYVPRRNPNPEEKLDVIVHIHGGAFLIGSGHMFTAPDILIDKEIIFVSFNYRLGILGFLSTEDKVVPGNNGMKDQVLALKWIQKNIASFGGNPDSVTLTGLSAGGASVHLHYFSEMSKGLFHRGFSQSGTALNAFSIQEGALDKAKILATAVGCPTSKTQILVDCLKQRPHLHLLNKLNLIFGYKVFPLAPFAPVVEKGPKPFLAANPYYLLKKGQVYDVPWISSTTAHEGFVPLIFGAKDDETFRTNWNAVAPFLLDFDYTLDKSQWVSASEKIRKFYFGASPVSTENAEVFAKMFGDRTFYVENENAVRLQARETTSPVYYYYFSYSGDNQIKLVGHGADSKYFYAFNFDSTPLTKNESKMKDVVVNMLISYVKTGTPIFNGVNWEPTSYEKLVYLNVTGFNPEEIIVVNSVDDLTPRAFWRSLQFLENENLFPDEKDEL